eukprot:CAMPEP_0197556448 /NCGR_PEP_ID=MMETSP1320-20131121/15165_1 /TAXON_ID=91990 /ORGANISM="Bolidomonas sp., Strain RCC2347" /LENGTH=43 /DNA_ID= /DNA_START= /DNA_END= /DNA_ORIENTATION=
MRWKDGKHVGRPQGTGRKRPPPRLPATATGTRSLSAGNEGLTS